MDAEELRVARERALAHLVQLRHDHAEIVAASEASNADDEHDPEGATIAFERQQLAALIGEAARRTSDLDRALEQLEASTYGACEACGHAIGAERLAARPSARTCIACAR